MSALVSVLFALAVAVALVLGSRLWFDRVQRARLQKRIGIEVLDVRRWREALDLLVAALGKDGLTQVAEVFAPGGAPLAERHLRRGSSSVLLIYKHGTSYRIGAAALLDAERRRQEAGLDEVVIATLGTVEPEAQDQAARMKVVCLDGIAVWSYVEALLDEATRGGVRAEAEALVERPRRLATLGSGVLGCALVVWGGALDPLLRGDPWAEDDLTTRHLPRAAPAALSVPTAAAAGVSLATGSATLESEPGSSTAEQRRALAQAMTALPEIERASWSSSSTLVVSLRSRVPLEQGVERACALSTEFPVLRDVRLQVEERSGDIRWRRCA